MPLNFNPAAATISPDAIRRMLLQGGDPSAMFNGDPSQVSATSAAGAQVASAPPSGVISSSMSGAPPAAPSQPPTGAAPSTPTPVSTSASTANGTASPPPSGVISQSMPSFATPEDKQQWLSEHPVATPPPRLGPFDKIPEGQPGADTWANRHNDFRRVLASLFAGAAEYGGAMNHHPGQGAAIVDRWADQDQANRQFNATLPAQKQQAENSAYDQYLEQQRSGAATAGTEAQTSKTLQEIQNMRVNPPGKQEFLQKFSAALKSGEEDPHAVLNQYLQLAGTVPGVRRNDLVELANATPEVPPSFKIGEQGIAQPLRYHGQVWSVNHQIKADPKNGFAGANLINEPNAPPALQQAAAAARTDEDQVQANKIQSQAAARSNIMLGQQYNIDKERNDKLLAEDTNLSDSQQRHDQLANAVDMAQKGNTIQAQNAVLKTLGLSLDGITKRINTTELAKFEQAGSVGQQIAGKLRGWTSGNPFPDSIWGDIKAFADQELTEAQQKHDRNVGLINKRLGGSQAAETPTAPATQQTQQGGSGSHVIKLNGKRYQYNGSGDTADMKNYTELK